MMKIAKWTFACVAGLCFWGTEYALSVELVQPCECDDLSIQIHQFSDEQWQTLLSIKDDTRSLNEVLKVYALPERSADAEVSLPAMFGACMLIEDSQILWFEPKYDLQEGVHYRVDFKLGQSKQTFEVYRPAQERVPNTVVRAIYPSGDRLPENLLKFYVHFSQPMSYGDVYRHIDLIDQDGRHLDRPFLEIAEELWDRSGTRLTLLLDPARIKRGLVPHEEDGAILFADHRYQLVIKDSWLDSTGTPLKESFTKTFVTVAADYIQPNPDQWHIEKPKAASTDPLTIRFLEPLDHAIAMRGITVLDSSGNAVAGTAATREHETQWVFQPESKWEAGQYRLKINERMEDLAGNSIARPFEVDRFDETESMVPNYRELLFEILSEK